jgi:hypothetical protein
MLSPPLIAVPFNRWRLSIVAPDRWKPGDDDRGIEATDRDVKEGEFTQLDPVRGGIMEAEELRLP